mmetsp:Transcript_36358/g.109107  ORF Transcript_36358/g.109107 Transcript_36358/m.109107 type:complete len:89 (-) Transcript_36358:259-525(-)
MDGYSVGPPDCPSGKDWWGPWRSWTGASSACPGMTKSTAAKEGEVNENDHLEAGMIYKRDQLPVMLSTRKKQSLLSATKKKKNSTGGI